jgi:hypothetical protein
MDALEIRTSRDSGKQSLMVGRWSEATVMGELLVAASPKRCAVGPPVTPLLVRRYSFAVGH